MSQLAGGLVDKTTQCPIDNYCIDKTGKYSNEVKSFGNGVLKV